jgi:hypothetical protein
MANIPVTIDWGNLPIGYCFTGPEAYKNDIFALLSASISNILGINFGNAVPAPADRDKPWMRTNPDGTPDKFYVYALGAWLAKHPVPASATYYIPYITALESDVWSFDGGDGSDPGTTPPTATTGAMWVVDHIWDFRSPMGAGTSSSGQVLTATGGTDLLGEDKHTLVAAEIPTHTHALRARSDIQGAGPGNIVCASTFSNTADMATDPYGGGLAHQNVHPVRGCWFIRRSARIYYTP